PSDVKVVDNPHLGDFDLLSASLSLGRGPGVRVNLSWLSQISVVRFRNCNDVRSLSSIARSFDSASAGIAGPRGSFCFCFAANTEGSFGTEQTGPEACRQASRRTGQSRKEGPPPPAGATIFGELARSCCHRSGGPVAQPHC